MKPRHVDSRLRRLSAWTVGVSMALLPFAGASHHHEPLGSAASHAEPRHAAAERPGSDVCVACMVHQAPSSWTGVGIAALSPPDDPGSTPLPPTRTFRAAPATVGTARAPPSPLVAEV